MSLVRSPHTVHVEICLEKNVLPLDMVSQKLTEPLKQYLLKHYQLIQLNKAFTINHPDQNFIDCPISSILVEYDSKPAEQKSLVEDDLRYLEFHYYYTYKGKIDLEPFTGEGDSEPIIASNLCSLPAKDYVNLWENLIYETGLKERLLKYSLSALTFAYHRINDNIISCNRLIFIHGPPGTGKTSLCRALAQKLAIRSRIKYYNTHLVEINSHSLFSKWFSESGKLVMRMFKEIRDLVVDSNNLVCILIDEVESLAYARDSLSDQEPKDSLRVVNALLQQMDSLRGFPNVLIFATSNLIDLVDEAFLDRADIKQFIDLPNETAIRIIYESMLVEMMRVGMIETESLTDEDKHEGLLTELAKRSKGLSGRTLRKIPFLAHGVYMANLKFNVELKIQLSDFLDAMMEAVDNCNKDYKVVKKDCNVKKLEP